MRDGRGRPRDGRPARWKRDDGAPAGAAGSDRSASASPPAPRRRRGGAVRGTSGSGDVGTTVAGYRLVRLIGKGSRCDVHLARPCRPQDPAAGPTENVAVKIVPATERSRGEAEILALQAVSSEHVVALRDVATLADGSLCIVQSLGQRGTAAALLGRRGSLTRGETVTLVASVLRGLGDLHQAGFAHGAVDLTHVVIDTTGRPMLGGLGSSCVVDGGAEDRLRGVDPVEQDLARVARIVQALLDPADAGGRASGDRWDTWQALLDSAIHGESDLTAHDLAERLLDVADAAPLAEAAGSSRGVDDDEPALPRGAASATLRAPTDRVPRTTTGRRARRPSMATPPGTHRRHRAVRQPGGSAARRVRGAVRRELRSVRPRVWALGASALLLLMLGAVAVPLLTGPARGATFAPASTSTPTTTPGTSADAEEPQATDTDVQTAASPDPDVAAPALLRLRAACLRRTDVTCLSGVDEAGSAVEDADRSAMAASTTESLDDAALHAADALGPAQRLGDGALIELRPGVDADAAAPSAPADGTGGSASGRRPASLLIVRGEAGWRIRDLMDDR
ncbi:serine/threonine protein kinase [Clavibacter lycopersici]|uniref:Serine/threonine protein kinase n=1 Tax=Clavibacter lycopersici TaxID=2301718 RepID=A0A399TB08_9MICO|nr:protein kinase [Clavibacter lycopersici]RIJ53336.1 serine/threonine protein kinase [Clavibacter lycopersici]RIJ62659.1 serine/threonine protein kinase [Clavibacter lycopersici]